MQIDSGFLQAIIVHSLSRSQPMPLLYHWHEVSQLDYLYCKCPRKHSSNHPGKPKHGKHDSRSTWGLQTMYHTRCRKNWRVCLTEILLWCRFANFSDARLSKSHLLVCQELPATFWEVSKFQDCLSYEAPVYCLLWTCTLNRRCVSYESFWRFCSGAGKILTAGLVTRAFEREHRNRK